MPSHQRRNLLLALVAALCVVGWVYRESFASIVEKWLSDSTFSHGFLIVPISLWLAWRNRAQLAGVGLKPSWLGVLALAGCAAAWLVARGTGVIVLEQFAVVGMIPAIVLAVLGWPATRTLIFPLAFLFFAVPFGRGLVPLMMQVTADVATLGLQWSGIPVFRSHMYISIPAGNFEVARACGGLNYVVTGIVLGVLYAYVNYGSWLKRAICVGAFLVVPILANGLRVYITILVSHLTDMRFGPGTEHIVFGRIFFIVIMLLMFWIGRRWHDDVRHVAHPPATGTSYALPASAWLPVAVAFAVALAAPPYLAASIAGTGERLADTAQLVRMPAGAAGWQGPAEDLGGWRPFYRGGLVERQGTYRDGIGGQVDVFVAVYGLGTSVGAEMISYGNLLFPEERGSLALEARRSVLLDSGDLLQVREVIVPGATGNRLVWQWFMVGDRVVLNEFAVKAYEALAFVSRSADSERIVTLATPLDSGARERLHAFVEAHASCVGAGFAYEACAE